MSLRAADGYRGLCEESGPSSANGRRRFKAHPGSPNGAESLNLLNQSLCVPSIYVCSDYVRVAGPWCCVCLLVHLYSREIVGCWCADNRPM